MQDFCPRINMLKGILLKKILRLMPVCQKLGMVLENKVVQKLKLEKKVFYKKWSQVYKFICYCLKVHFTDLSKDSIKEIYITRKCPLRGPS